jgi:hypothetical protein
MKRVSVKAPRMARQILMGSNWVQMMAHWTYWESNLVQMMAHWILKDSMMAPMKALMKVRSSAHLKALRMAPMRARLLDWWRRKVPVKAPRMARQI